MYVAFNRFYPPELGQVERRTASPDRSHNETWDALVTTGVVGLAAYLVLFASVFYYGLKWLGLMNTPLQKRLFLACYAGGGLAGAAGLVLWRGLPFFGVGLPFGIMLGLIAYLTVQALLGPEAAPAERPEPWRAVVLISLVAAVMAHFTEIHFGIAVAASRTLFWLFAALMAVAGMGLLAPIEVEARRKKEEGRRKRPAPARTATSSLQASAWLVSAGIVGAVLAILAYDFINNPSRLVSTGSIVWQSLTTLPRIGVGSFGVLLIILITWGCGCLLFAAEDALSAGGSPPIRAWAQGLAVSAGLALALGLAFAVWVGGIHARLASTPIQSEAELLATIARLSSVMTALYLYLGVLVLGLGAALAQPGSAPAAARRGAATAWLAAPVGMVVLILAYTTNLRVIHADVIFKTAEGYAGANNWEAATRLYLLASANAPNEDYYYLFVGKGYLQLADQLGETGKQAEVFEQARQRLVAAQAINPLNTDHTANLGRLYRWWASVDPNQAERLDRAQIAGDYYARALTLSPNSALLWNEWASLDLALAGDSAGALEKIEHSLALDPKFDKTYSLLGDYHANQARLAGDTAVQLEEYEQAAEAYQQALQLQPDELNPRLALGAVYSATGQIDQAIEWYTGAVEHAPPEANLVNVYRALADLHRRAGSDAEAVRYAELALAAAPDELKPEIQRMIESIRGT
jgi:tetratricopeptide (TPR) repeat protein